MYWSDTEAAKQSTASINTTAAIQPGLDCSIIAMAGPERLSFYNAVAETRADNQL